MTALRAGHIKQITAVSRPFPDGQYLTEAILTYDQPLSCVSVDASAFSVRGRTVLKAYTVSELEEPYAAQDGPCVVLELDREDQDALLLQTMDEYGRVPRNAPDTVSPDRPVFSNYTSRCECRVEVLQKCPIGTTDGLLLPALSEYAASTKAINRIVDSFTVFSYEDLNVSIYLPKHSGGEKLPLVLFLSDASVLGEDPYLPLLQGNGAVSFADPLFQKDHPCIVLAPAIPEKYKYRSNQGLDAAKPLVYLLSRLLEHVCGNYNVDRNRIYLTGQSLGCFTACAMSLLYPSRFAAGLLVAGQWNAQEMAALHDHSFWMIVSGGDRIAAPAMEAIAREMEAQGASVDRYAWDAQDPLPVLQKAARQAAADPGNIKLSVWKENSVVTKQYEPSPVSNHFCTWPVTYSLDGPKEWLLAQSLER